MGEGGSRGRPGRVLQVGAALLLCAALAAACSSSGSGRGSGKEAHGPVATFRPADDTPLTAPIMAPISTAPGTAVTTSTTIAPTTTTAVPGAPLAVTGSTLAIEDTSRAVVRAGVQVAPTRKLPTTVWLPAGPGPFPLVVFAHGYRLGPLSYARFCAKLASAGYLVVVPSFPLADQTRGLGLDRADIPNEATDVSYVIGVLLRSYLSPRIADGQIAVVGHSDGADVALLVGYDKVKFDPRVQAVAAIAPDAMTGGVINGGVPLLLAQGTADSVVPYSNSKTVFAQVTAPRTYLSLLGADHLPPIQGNTRWTPVLDESVAGFLDAAIAHRPRQVGHDWIADARASRLATVVEHG